MTGEVLKGYRLELEAVSPVHVGTGETFPAYAYVPVPAERRVYLLDTAKLLYTLPEERREEYLKQIADGPRRAQWVLRGLWHQETPAVRAAVVRSLSASVAFFNTIDKVSDEADLEFRPLPQSLRGPYLPGSSLKGALRTAWLYYAVVPNLEKGRDLLYEEGRDLLHEKRVWNYVPQPQDEEGMGWIVPPKRPRLSDAQNFEGFVLKHGRKFDRDPFRALRIGDTGPVEETKLDRIAVYHPSGKLDKTLLLAETLPQEARLTATLRYHEGLTRTQERHQPVVTAPVPPDELAKAAREFYTWVLEEEESFADENRLENARQLYKTMRQHLDDDPTLFPLRLGFGSGELGTTLAVIADMPRPQTRKTVGSTTPAGGLPLGWLLARLTPL